MLRRHITGCKGLLTAAVAIVLLLVAGVPSALADSTEFISKLSESKGNIRSGNLAFHPGVELTGTFDDNIFNTAVDEKSDFISTITPGVFLSLGSRHKLELGYAAGINYYSNFTDENFTSHSARASFNLDFPAGLNVSFLDNYLQTKDPRGEERQIRASHRSNDIDFSVDYVFPAEKLTIRAMFTENWLKYDQTANNDRNKRTDVFGGAVLYRFMPKTFALVEYMYGLTNYFDSTDALTDKNSKSHAVNVGLQWDPTSKLSGTLKTGWMKKTYDNALDPSGNAYVDKDLWGVEAVLTYLATDRTKFDIYLNRSIDDTDYTGSASYSTASHYVNVGGSLAMEHVLVPKLTLKLKAGFQRHEYEQLQAALLARSDSITEFDAGLRYDVRKWLSTAVNYSYYNNNSDDDTRDEKHNRTSLSVTAVF